MSKNNDPVNQNLMLKNNKLNKLNNTNLIFKHKKSREGGNIITNTLSQKINWTKLTAAVRSSFYSQNSVIIMNSKNYIRAAGQNVGLPSISTEFGIIPSYKPNGRWLEDSSWYNIPEKGSFSIKRVNIGLAVIFADDERRLKIFLSDFYKRSIPIAVCFTNGCYINDPRISYPILNGMSDSSSLINDFQNILKSNVKTSCDLLIFIKNILKKTAVSKKTSRFKQVKSNCYPVKVRSLTRCKIATTLPKHNVNLGQKEFLSSLNFENFKSIEGVFEAQKKRHYKRHKKSARR